MSVSTVTQARDEMLAKFLVAWKASSTSCDLPVIYGDVVEGVPASGAWARIVVRHNTGGAATIGGETGNRRFRHAGIVMVQIFTEHADGQVLSDLLAEIANDAFEGEVTSPGRVIFRNVRINEVGLDGQWFQVNVLAEFEYDRVK